MDKNFLIIPCIAVVGFFVGSIDSDVAAMNSLPRLNTNKSCESPARRLVAHQHSVDACFRSEREAHAVLVKRWHRYSESDRSRCIGIVTHGGPPSYVELHACLDSAEHARKIRKRKPAAI
jgi:hypothetical protein